MNTMLSFLKFAAPFLPALAKQAPAAVQPYAQAAVDLLDGIAAHPDPKSIEADCEAVAQKIWPKIEASLPDAARAVVQEGISILEEVASIFAHKAPVVVLPTEQVSGNEPSLA